MTATLRERLHDDPIRQEGSGYDGNRTPEEAATAFQAGALVEREASEIRRERPRNRAAVSAGDRTNRDA